MYVLQSEQSPHHTGFVRDWSFVMTSSTSDTMEVWLWVCKSSQWYTQCSHRPLQPLFFCFCRNSIYPILTRPLTYTYIHMAFNCQTTSDYQRTTLQTTSITSIGTRRTLQTHCLLTHNGQLDTTASQSLSMAAASSLNNVITVWDKQCIILHTALPWHPILQYAVEQGYRPKADYTLGCFNWFPWWLGYMITSVNSDGLASA